MARMARSKRVNQRDSLHAKTPPVHIGRAIVDCGGVPETHWHPTGNAGGPVHDRVKRLPRAVEEISRQFSEGSCISTH
jgi:hypothetical protein